MSSANRPPISSAEIEISGQNFSIFYAAFEYPTEFAARNAWERADKKRYDEQLISVFRLTTPDKDDSCVVAISEKEGPVKTARRLISSGGTVFEPEEGLLRKLLMRRMRVAVEEAPHGGQSLQKARYGKSGAVLDDRGQTRPYKRPQG
jgi:hypothetical protein